MRWFKASQILTSLATRLEPVGSHSKIHIVLWSFSGYADVFEMTINQLSESADDSVPLNIVVLADDKRFVEVILNRMPANPSVTVQEIIEYDESTDFWRKIASLRKAHLSRRFIFLQEDFVLYGTPDWRLIAELVGKFRKTRHAFLRLVPSGHQTQRPISETLHGRKFIRVNHHSAYHHSWQATVWKKASFFIVNRLSRPRSIRDENKPRYRRVMRALSINGIASLDNLLPYVQTAVRGGKWDFGATPGGTELPQLLLKYGINPNLRGIRPPKNSAKHDTPCK